MEHEDVGTRKTNDACGIPAFFDDAVATKQLEMTEKELARLEEQHASLLESLAAFNTSTDHYERACRLGIIFSSRFIKSVIADDFECRNLFSVFADEAIQTYNEQFPDKIIIETEKMKPRFAISVIIDSTEPRIHIMERVIEHTNAPCCYPFQKRENWFPVTKISFGQVTSISLQNVPGTKMIHNLVVHLTSS